MRQQRELLVLEHLLHQRTQAELRGLEAHAGGLPGAEGQQVLDHALQLDAVLAQDRGHLALVGIELAHRSVHQQLRAFADVGKGRLELVRHVAQETVALVCELEQPLAQPLELPPQALEVVRPGDRDLVGESALAELADGAVKLPQRPADAECEHEHRDDGERQERCGLPQQALARLLGLLFQCGHFRVHLGVALLGYALDHGGQLREAARQVRSGRGAGAGGRGHDREADASLQYPELVERPAGIVRGLKVQLLAGGGQAFILGAVQVEELRVAEHVVQARRALEGCDLPEQRLAGTRAGDALNDDFRTRVGEIADLQHGGEKGDQERHGDQRQAD